MVCFLHAINYRNNRGGDQIMYRPTLESLRVCGDVKSETTWGTDPSTTRPSWISLLRG